MKKLIYWIIGIVILVNLPKACSSYNGDFDHDVKVVMKEFKKNGYNQDVVNHIDDELRWAGYENAGDRSMIMTEAYHKLRNSE